MKSVLTRDVIPDKKIIARMESRERLAKTIVKLQLSSFVSAPTSVYDKGKPIGTLTSSVESPNGEYFAVAVIKTGTSISGTELTVGDTHIPAIVLDYAGQQPSFINKT